jgi:hypothetical protein
MKPRIIISNSYGLTSERAERKSNQPLDGHYFAVRRAQHRNPRIDYDRTFPSHLAWRTTAGYVALYQELNANRIRPCDFLAPDTVPTWPEEEPQ